MNLLHFIEDLRSPAGDLFFQGITYIAQELLVVAIICWLFWCGSKMLAYRLAFSYFITILTIQGLKITFRIPRPWVLDPTLNPVASAIPGATGYSFPSGHTQSGTAFFTTIASVSRRWYLKALCVLGFVLIGLSRLYLGVHTPKDVFTSMGVTFLLTCMICHFWGKYGASHTHDKTIAIILALASSVLALYDFHLVRTGVLSAENAMDCCKACGAGLAFAIGFYVERRYVNFSAPVGLKHKILRFLIGITVTALLEFGLKYLLPETLFTSYLRYLLIILWIIAIYPWLFQRFEKRKTSQKTA